MDNSIYRRVVASAKDMNGEMPLAVEVSQVSNHGYAVIISLDDITVIAWWSWSKEQAITYACRLADRGKENVLLTAHGAASMGYNCYG